MKTRKLGKINECINVDGDKTDFNGKIGVSDVGVGRLNLRGLSEDTSAVYLTCVVALGNIEGTDSVGGGSTEDTTAVALGVSSNFTEVDAVGECKYKAGGSDLCGRTEDTTCIVPFLT